MTTNNTEANVETNAKISEAILAEFIVNGNDVQAAIDTVLGSGTFDGIVDDLYNKLKG